MSEITRPLNEVIERHSLNPDFCDVYVEGTTDRGLLERFFEESGRIDVAVYEIDTIEIPSSVVRDFDLENNNRGRVIALARLLYEKFGTVPQVTGVVDADLGYALDEYESCPLVLMTDYTSMEMYFFDTTSLKRFIRCGCPSVRITAEALLQTITPILEKLFIARIVNRVLDWRLKAVSLSKSCEFAKDPLRITLDWNHYLKRYLGKNNRLRQAADFAKVFKKWEKKMSSIDLRRRIHGHDFLDIVAWCCSNFKAAAELGSGDVAGAMLRSGASCFDLRSEKMFETLLKQYPGA
jgi:Protein of unknown function (DUF4435)